MSLALGLKDEPPLAIEPSGFGVQPDRLAVVGNGVVLLSCLAIGVTAHWVGFARLGFKTHGFVQVGNRAIEFQFDNKSISAIYVSPRVLGVEPNRFSVSTDGLVVIAQLEVNL